MKLWQRLRRRCPFQRLDQSRSEPVWPASFSGPNRSDRLCLWLLIVTNTSISSCDTPISYPDPWMSYAHAVRHPRVWVRDWRCSEPFLFFQMKFLQFSARSFGNAVRLSAAMLRVSRLSTTPAGQASQDDLLPRTLRCHNGQKVPGTFSAQEMQRRVAMVRAHMAAEDIEACVFTSIHNVNYFSDFLYCSFGRPFALVITPDKAVTVSPGLSNVPPTLTLVRLTLLLPSSKKYILPTF